MKVKAVLVTVLFSSLLLVGGNTTAFGAQLETFLNPNSQTSPFEIKYQKTVFIEYEDGGELADALRGTEDTIAFKVGPENEGVQGLMNKINQKLSLDGSSAKVSDVTVDYSAHMTGRPLNTSIDFKIVLRGTLSDYIIVERQGSQQQALVDLGWRGLTVTGAVNIQGVDINHPISAIESLAPSVHSAVAGSEAQQLLSENLIDAQAIKDQPLSNWHFLFDPTGINVDAGTFGLDESISGFVVSAFTMGESSLREGRQVERVKEATFSADRTYVIRTVQSADNANLRVVGFAAIDSLDGVEILGVTPKPPEGYATTSTGEFPIFIIYGMAGLAAVGGGAFFVFSNRQLKKEGNQGQTGIDPSRLRGYQTSASSGGYQTNRGEAQLADGSDYAQHRSVYDEQQSQQDTKPAESSRGSMPKGWKPE